MTTVLYLSVHVLFLGIDLVFLRDLFLAIGSRTPFLLNQICFQFRVRETYSRLLYFLEISLAHTKLGVFGCQENPLSLDFQIIFP